MKIQLKRKNLSRTVECVIKIQLEYQQPESLYCLSFQYIAKIV